MEMMGRPSESTSTDSGVVVIEESALFNSNVDISANIMKSKNNSVNIDKSVDNNKESENNSGKNSDDTRDSPVSTHISIESLENDEDSSVIDSDSDCDEIPPNGDFIIQKLGQHASESGTDGIVVISQSTNQNPVCTNGITAKPNIGTIAVQNSTDITFGSKTFYQGPVTIKQFLLDKDKWKPKTDDGNINPAFDATDTASRTKFSGQKQWEDNRDQAKPEKMFLRTKVAVTTGVLLLTSIILIPISIISINAIKSKWIENNAVLQFVTRDAWKALPPKDGLTKLDLPATRVIIAHTATESCSTESSCRLRLHAIQEYHMFSREWSDIGYNFLVGGDGSVYEGRGWDTEGAHTRGFNKNSICIAFIGTFTQEPPPRKQLQAAQLILEEGLKLNKLATNYKLYGHRQLIPTESPGEPLYSIIKTWPHWSDQVN